MTIKAFNSIQLISIKYNKKKNKESLFFFTTFSKFFHLRKVENNKINQENNLDLHTRRRVSPWYERGMSGTSFQRADPSVAVWIERSCGDGS